MSESKKIPKDLSGLLITLLILLISITLINTWTIKSFTVDSSKSNYEPIQKVKISLTFIQDTTCKECFDMNSVTNEFSTDEIIKNEKIELNTNQAKELIKLYNIQKIPALIVTGETEKANGIKSLSSMGKTKEKTFIVEAPQPVYINTKTKTQEGYVTIIVLTENSCSDCFAIEDILNQLTNVVKIKTVNKIESTSNQGKEIIKKYNITKTPTIILSKEAIEYPLIKQSWKSLGTIDDDGSLILRNVLPPYKDQTTNTIKGQVQIIQLIDETCKECYNVSIHETPLKRLGMQIKNEKKVEIKSSEGQSLIKKYGIELVPTIILTGDVNAYNIENTWKSVGSIEKDGTYVFRNVAILEGQTYKNITTGKIVT